MKKVLFSVVVIGIIAYIGLYIFVHSWKGDPPLPNVTAGDRAVFVVHGSYCWDSKVTFTCADMDTMALEAALREAPRTPIAPNTSLRVEFKEGKDKKGFSVYQQTDEEKNEKIRLKEGMFHAPKEKGVYVYDVYMSSERGTASYQFLLEVK